MFLPRGRKVTLKACVDHIPQSLSPYRMSPDDIIVYDGSQSYEQDQDFAIDLASGRSDFVPYATMAGKIVSVQLTEYFPAYQCSTNNMDWSPAILFDADRPFLDVRKNYFPISITDGWFPVVDELGSPLGIEIKPVAGLSYEALLRIETKASPDFGLTGILEIEFDRPGYYNGLRLTPFVNMPVHLKQLQAEGFLNTNDFLFDGDVILDRPVSIRFADANGKPAYVRRLSLTLYQPNYELKKHAINPADELRQASMARLETVLPFSDRAVQAALPTILNGAQYEIGLRELAGERYTAYPTGAGVFISGPFTIDGTPEIIRLDAEFTGTVDCTLCVPVAGNTRLFVLKPMPSGTTLSFRDAWGSAPIPPQVDFYLKWVFRTDDAVLTRFLLQVTKGA